MTNRQKRRYRNQKSKVLKQNVFYQGGKYKFSQQQAIKGGDKIKIKKIKLESWQEKQGIRQKLFKRKMKYRNIFVF